jgi:hypothetical protein
MYDSENGTYYIDSFVRSYSHKVAFNRFWDNFDALERRLHSLTILKLLIYSCLKWGSCFGRKELAAAQ